LPFVKLVLTFFETDKTKILQVNPKGKDGIYGFTDGNLVATHASHTWVLIEDSKRSTCTQI
jgi:hypothetical protein